MSDKDRIAICDIISWMLDNPDEHSIYPTSTAFTRLEYYIAKVRADAIEATHINICKLLDKKEDPRTQSIWQVMFTL